MVGLGAVLALLAVYSVAAVGWVERTYPPIGDFVTVEGVRLHYVSAGNDEPALVLLHGASGSLRDFRASIVPGLAERHRVIAFDRPGHGYSERPDGEWPDPARQAALVRGGLLELGIDRPLLVGHSWSGAVVLAYLLDYPDEVRGGVLLAGLANAWDGTVSWHTEVASWPVIGPLFAATAVFPAGQLLLDQVVAGIFAPEAPVPDYRTRIGAALALRPAAFRANAEDMRNVSQYLETQRERYGEIEVPLLLVTGERDTIVPSWNHADVVAARVPHAERIDLPGAGHAFHHTRTEEVVRLISDFARDQ